MNQHTDIAMMTIRVDDRDHQVPLGFTLAELVMQLGHQANAVTTALNGSFVPRDQRAALALQSGDAVMLFKPIGGG